MAKHKAATQVSIASTTDESDFHKVVQTYWKPAALIVVGIAAVAMWSTYRGEQKRTTSAASWDRLRQEVGLGPSVSTPSPAVLASISDELGDQVAAPWSKALEVSAYVKDESFDGARTALDELEARWPSHTLVANGHPLEKDGTEVKLGAHLRGRMAALSSWEKQHPFLFGLPDAPADAPRVKLSTSEGDIVVALYEGRAPKHVANFLKLCGEGFYDNTLFHRVLPNFMIQGGDPNTRDAENPDDWGTGGPGYTLAQELSDLKHFTYALAAAKNQGEVESGGSQFYITTGTPHHLDGLHTVFGRVVEGHTVVDKIGSAPVTGDRPNEPVTVLSTEVL